MKKNSNVPECFIDKWLKKRSPGQHFKKTIKIKEMRIDGRRRRAVFFMPKEGWVKGERKEDQTMAVSAGEMKDSEEATHTNPSEGDLSLRLPVEVVLILISLVMALLPLVFTAFFFLAITLACSIIKEENTATCPLFFCTHLSPRYLYLYLPLHTNILTPTSYATEVEGQVVASRKGLGRSVWKGGSSLFVPVREEKRGTREEWWKGKSNDDMDKSTARARSKEVGAGREENKKNKVAMIKNNKTAMLLPKTSYPRSIYCTR